MEFSVSRFLMASSALNIEINGIFVPYSSVVENFQRFCKPLIIKTNDPIFDTAVSGSCFLTRYRGANLLICTRHQLKIDRSDSFSPSMIVTPILKGGNVFGARPIGARWPLATRSRDRTWDDIMAVQFLGDADGDMINHLFLRTNWDTIETGRDIDRSNILSFFAIGYLTSASDYNVLYDTQYCPLGIKLTSRWRPVFLKPTLRSSFDLDTRIQFKQDEALWTDIQNADGLSGSPVFFVYRRAGNKLHWGIAGIITHVRNDVFQVYDAENMKSFITSGLKE